MRPPRVVPYVVGQWVRGERFYGRHHLIAEILEGQRNSIWVLGTRRVGKTSLLKQLEHLTSKADRGLMPVFWDFQGADDADELAATFSDALLDAEERLQAVGVAVSEVAGDDLFASMAALRRRLRSHDLTLLLLCDEVEELVNLHRRDAALLRKLRRAMQSQEGIRSVLASSVRLFALTEQRDDTSPFLHGFSPPLYIHGLSQDEARSLIRQDHLPPQSRPSFEPEEVENIRGRCHDHPYLIQLLCKRFCELGDLDEACEQVAADSMVSYFFSVDFEMLSEEERVILRVLADRGTTSAGALGAILRDRSGTGELHRLANLGFIRRGGGGSYEVGGLFFRRWLSGLAAAGPPGPAPGRSSDAATGSESTLSLATLDGRYALMERVGDGASGTVFKAWDTLLRSWVAVKLLRPEYTADPDALERVRQEIILSRDIGHPNILRTYHLAVSEGRAYLTMQWIDGRTLADDIADRGPLPLYTALAIAGKLAAALAAAHGRKILHRDIKPSNILMSDDGEPHLADFGLARLIGGPGSVSHGLFVGTPHYASPEQAALEPLDERSDIYALGLVLFEMTTGQRPFGAGSVAEILARRRDSQPPDPRTFIPDIPARVAAVILRCLARDSSARFASADELAAALDQVAPDVGRAAGQKL